MDARLARVAEVTFLLKKAGVHVNHVSDINQGPGEFVVFITADRSTAKSIEILNRMPKLAKVEQRRNPHVYRVTLKE